MYHFPWRTIEIVQNNYKWFTFTLTDQGRKNCTTRNGKCYALSKVGPATWDSAECQAGEFLVERPCGVGTNFS